MKQFAAMILSLTLFASSAQAGMLIFAAGGLAANRTSSNALPYAGLAIGGALVAYEAMQFNPSLLVTVLDGDTLEQSDIQKDLAEKFPFLDDAYVIEALSSKLAAKFERGEALKRGEKWAEVMLEASEVKNLLEPTALSQGEIEEVARALSTPMEI